MSVARASVTDINVRRPIRAGSSSGAKVVQAQYTTSLVHRHTLPPVFMNVRVSDYQFSESQKPV